jgi:hypothetical protein
MNHQEVNRIISGELLVADVGGVAYATDRCWFAPAKRTVVDLLHWWNLDLDPPQRFGRDGERWFKLSGTVPDMKTVTGIEPSAVARLVRDDVSGLPVFVGSLCGGGNALAMFDTPEGRAYVRRDFLRLCAGEGWDQKEWWCDAPTTGIRHESEDGMVVVMPMRGP